MNLQCKNDAFVICAERINTANKMDQLIGRGGRQQESRCEGEVILTTSTDEREQMIDAAISRQEGPNLRINYMKTLEADLQQEQELKMALASIIHGAKISIVPAQKKTIKDVINGFDKLWFPPHQDGGYRHQRRRWEEIREIFGIHKSWFPPHIKQGLTLAMLRAQRVVHKITVPDPKVKTQRASTTLPSSSKEIESPTKRQKTGEGASVTK